MMSKFNRSTMVGVSALVLFATALAWRLPSLAQQPPGGQPPDDRRGRRVFDPAQMVDMVLDRMQLNDAERAATKETWLAKISARNALIEKVSQLREVAENPQSSEEDLKRALGDFAAAYQTYAKTVSEADGKLVKKISLRTRARLTAMGILENGVGFGGGFRFMGRPRRPDGNDRSVARRGGDGQ
ncbi:MAG: hypothetical protein NZT92_21195 [Abditibacteriales bacterium]|nr:hypothetical protein [Abditibacteriales bacterium]MDW8367818.1 hypothetical protein [Abditibacteriales bacterium]